MRLTIPLAYALILTTTPALADWQTRPTDSLLSQADLDTTVRGHALEFFDGGISAFETGGEYSWTYGEGGTWLGHFTVGTDSTICVTFVTQVTRCDLYVHDGERLVVITENGMRFPVKIIR